MNIRYENEFSAHLLENKDFVNDITNAIVKLYDKQTEIFFQNSNIEAKTITDAKNNIHYLIVNRQGNYEVYSNDRSNSFQYEKSQIAQGERSEIYSESLVTVTTDKEDYIDLDNVNNISLENIMEYANKMRKDFYSKKIGFVSSAFQLSNFLNFLVQEKALSFFDSNMLLDNPKLNETVDTRLEEFTIIINFLNKVVTEHNLNDNKKFSFNDGDSHLWKSDKYLMLDDQSCTYAIDYKDVTDFDIYSVLHSHHTKSKKHSEITPLLEDLKNGNCNFIDHTALSVRSGKTVYADNCFINSLDMNLLYTKDQVVNEGLGEIEYPIDTRDFDYQLAHSCKRYGNTKESFLMHALFVLGNGFTYDKNSGRIYTDIPYDSSVMKDYEVSTSDEKLTDLGYFYPIIGISKLDEKWTNALEYIVGKIKEDKPDTSNARLPYGKTVEDILSDLEKIIEDNSSKKVVKMKK